MGHSKDPNQEEMSLEEAVRISCEIARKRAEELRRNPDPVADKLIQACRDGSMAMVSHLLQKKANINAYRSMGTPLGEAITSTNAAELTEFLLDYGADPNLLDPHGSCPLFIAASIDQAACARLLLTRGANKDLPHIENGWTPLMTAAASGSVLAMIELLSFGADANLKSKDGLTAIDLAKGNGKLTAARVLSHYFEILKRR